MTSSRVAAAEATRPGTTGETDKGAAERNEAASDLRGVELGRSAVRASSLATVAQEQATQVANASEGVAGPTKTGMADGTSSPERWGTAVRSTGCEPVKGSKSK
ncbi:MAG TPA: hypothetical protein VK579_00995 [Terriglobales bacterium]|nr:hypothetical protein [Terriglobales bacterium]